MIRSLIGLAVVVGALVAVIASASTLSSVDSSPVQAGSSIDLECDEDGVTVTYDTAWDPTDGQFEITGFKVGDIDQPDCASKEFWVRLTWLAPLGASNFQVQTDTSSELQFSVSPPRAANALVGMAIAMYQ